MEYRDIKTYKALADFSKYIPEQGMEKYNFAFL